MQRGRGGVKPPIGVAFDGDLGNRIDAVLAVAMLNGLSSKGEARRISLSVSRTSLKAAQLADVISTFFAGRPAGGGTGGIGAAREGMIGMPEGAPPDDAPPLAAILSKKTPEGAAQYPSTIGSLVDTAETKLYIRNLLLAQDDGNATIVMAGPATGVARLIDLYRAGPQVVAKVKQLVVAVGAFPAGQPDPSVKADLAAARKLFAEWPTPLVAVGREVGELLPYPGASIDADFTWSPAHPVVDAYRALKATPYDAPASALAALLYAVHPEENYFKLSEPGTITVLDDGRTQFAARPDGKHRYLIVDTTKSTEVTKLYKELVSAKPAARPGGRGRGPAVDPAQQQLLQQQQQQQQANPPKPPDVKPPTP
jgi:hypothetical protein